MIPQSVMAEIAAGRHRDASCDSTLKWAERYRIPNATLPSTVEEWRLGAGESQVITIQILHGGKAVLDDRMGRRCATAHDLPVIGTTGLVLLAKRLGVLHSARTVLTLLRHNGLFLEEKWLERLLDQLEE